MQLDMPDVVLQILVRATYTDIFVILLHHSYFMDAHIWMDTGTGKDNTRKYIDITTLSNDLAKDLCDALPGFHVFTGSDLPHLSWERAK